MKIKFLFPALFLLLLTGCLNEFREAGLHKTDFAEISAMGCTYRLYSQAGEFIPGEKIDFTFSIINETDSAKTFDLADGRFLYVYLKNPDNQIFYKERIAASRFINDKELVVQAGSNVSYSFSLLPQKSFTDTIRSIYCQAQLTLLPKGLDYNRLSFYIRRK